MIELDTTDVDRWVGKPLGGGILKDPIHPNDVRRWAQGMQNPNPLYFEEEYAAASPLGAWWRLSRSPSARTRVTEQGRRFRV